MHLSGKGYLFLIVLHLPLVTSAQITLSGTTRDSASFAPLPFVSIQVSGKVVSISNAEGSFAVNCQQGDTILFNRLGFKTTKLIRFKSENTVSVMMAESTTVLKSITIFGNYKPHGKARWREYIVLPKLFQNPTMKDSAGMIQTFGPGVIIPGPISYFTKYEKERRKIKRVLTDQAATSVYREVISSSKVKEDLISLFSLTEEQYFKKIEAFNIKNPEVAYLKNRDEIINMLILFFTLREK
jgi:hypothetical protein